MKMKKLMAVIMAGAMVMGMTACGSSNEENNDSSKTETTQDAEGTDDAAAMEGEIAVVTREDGSGTRVSGKGFED